VLTALGCVLAPVALSTAAQQEQQQRQLTVLALNSLRRGAPAGAVNDAVFQKVLGGGGQRRLDYYVEEADAARFPGLDYGRTVRDYLRAKYRGRRFDVVIASGDSALEFAASYRGDLFPDTPIVFSTRPGQPLPENATGVLVDLNFYDGVEIIATLHPRVRRVVVVSGSSEWDKYYEHVARTQFERFGGRLEFQYLSGLPMARLLHTVGQLPRDAVIYYLSVSEDGEGLRDTPVEALERIAAVASVPIYGWHSVLLEHGIVGGSLMSQEAVASRLAALALRVVSGEDAGGIPVETFDANVRVFDWRQLRRWGVDEALVPPDSTVLFRQPTMWQQYRAYIIAGLTLMAVQSALIGALLLQRARRRQTEQTLRQSEARYALATAAGATGVWDWSLDTNAIYVDPQLKRLLGFEDHEIHNHLDDWGRRVHPDDSAGVMAEARACVEGHSPIYENEHRMLHKDGTIRWFLARGRVMRGDDGVATRFVGTDTDITDLKRAQGAVQESEAALRASNEEIRDLAGRLIVAQEAERTRIARDLHDDVSQQLAGLSIAMSNVRRLLRSAEYHGEVDGALAALQQRTLDLGESVRHLSHRLHPGVLQHAGLVSALRSHCEEFGKQNDIAIAFAADDEFGSVGEDIKLCLLRVAQEALRNTARHSAARHAEVRLTRTPDGAELTVVDDGKGFDVAFVGRRGHGLGLRSIHERVRQAGGTVTILAEARRGTTVQVHVPLSRPVGVAGRGAAEAGRS
jgi:PAS domain S-box-containing protein